jgi:hypothetical protein
MPPPPQAHPSAVESGGRGLPRAGPADDRTADSIRDAQGYGAEDWGGMGASEVVGGAWVCQRPFAADGHPCAWEPQLAGRVAVMLIQGVGRENLGHSWWPPLESGQGVDHDQQTLTAARTRLASPEGYTPGVVGTGHWVRGRWHRVGGWTHQAKLQLMPQGTVDRTRESVVAELVEALRQHVWQAFRWNGRGKRMRALVIRATSHRMLGLSSVIA